MTPPASPAAPARVLVTGASGLVGRQAVPALLALGHEVHAVSRSETPAPGVVTHSADLLDPVALDRLMADVRPTHVLHFAWYTVHGKFWAAPENLDWQAASVRLARRFAEQRVEGGHEGGRFVAAGTVAEYDWSHAGAPLSEAGTPCEPRTFYGAVKDATRRTLQAYCRQAGVSFAWGRIFFPFGPGDVDRFVPSVALPLLKGLPAKCNTPSLRRDLMSSDQVAAAFIALLFSKVEGAVNIATGVAQPLGETATLIAKLIGRPDLLTLGSAGPSADHPLTLAADVTRLTHEVGFVPDTDLARHLSDFVSSLPRR